MPFHSTINILIITMVGFLLIYFAWNHFNGETIFIFSICVYFLQSYFTWYGIVWFKSLFEDFYPSFERLVKFDSEESRMIFIKESRIIFNPTLAMVSGLIIGLLSGVGQYVLGTTPFGTDGLGISYMFFAIYIMFFTGAAAYTVIAFVWFITKIGLKIPFESNISYVNNSYLNKLGSLHLKISLLAILPYGLGIIARLIGPWSWQPVVLVWYTFFGILLVLFIFIPFYRIHELMVLEKEAKLEKLQLQLNEAIELALTESSSLNLKKCQDLELLERNINNISTWPFETKNVVALFMTIIVPVLIMIIDKYLL